MLKNTENSFGIVSRVLHWGMSITLISMLFVGFYMTGLEKTPYKFTIYSIHKSVGVLLVLLVIFRLLWRIINIKPLLPTTMPSWQIMGYRFGVGVMYTLMFAMPISGIIMSLYAGRDISVFNLFTLHSFGKNTDIANIAYNIHSIGAIAFIIFIGLHSSVALFHHFIDKDRLLLKMIFGK